MAFLFLAVSGSFFSDSSSVLLLQGGSWLGCPLLNPPAYQPLASVLCTHSHVIPHGNEETEETTGPQDVCVCDTPTPALSVPTAVAPSPRIPITCLLVVCGADHCDLPVASKATGHSREEHALVSGGFEPWLYQLLLMRLWTCN